MAERSVFKLSFGTNVGETDTFTIPHANKTLDADGVRSIMQQLIDSEMISKNGFPISIKGAERISYNSVPVDFEE